MQGGRGGGMIDPHPSWRGDGVWTRSRNLEAMVVGCTSICNKNEGWNKDSKCSRSMICWKSVQKEVMSSLRKYDRNPSLLFCFPLSSFYNRNVCG